MPPRLKKLVGFALFLPALLAYFVLAVTVSDFVPNHQLLKALYFLVAGVVWAFPAKYLFQWMNKEPDAPRDPKAAKG